MLNIIKERMGELLSIHLDGAVIGEYIDFERLIGPTPHSVRVNCKNVVRINSNGVRSWIKFFQNLKNKGIAVSFSECSPATVESLNMFSNFSCGGQVESVYVPYCCTGCNKELIGLYKTTDLAAVGFKIPELDCPMCGRKAVFDDNPEQYFRFASRKAAT